MECAVIVRAQEAMQVNIEYPIARNDPPSQQVWTLDAADDKIWIALISDPVDEKVSYFHGANSSAPQNAMHAQKMKATK